MSKEKEEIVQKKIEVTRNRKRNMTMKEKERKRYLRETQQSKPKRNLKFFSLP
jgi:hypothetical protein